MNQILTITLLQGLPGSGKSTLARKRVADGKGSVVRVNKDELRTMLFPGLPWSHKQEDTVFHAQRDIVESLLNKKHIDEIIIDDTNFNPKVIDAWKRYASPRDHIVVNIERVNTDIDTCIANDLKRKSEGGHYVGKDVILNMAFKYGLAKQDRPFVVFDLDGTLCDITARKQAAARYDGSLDYGIFFNPAMIDLDVPRHDIIAKIKEHQALGHEIVILSGRSDRTKEATKEWFAKYGVEYDRLIMRPNANSQDDAILKTNFMNDYLDKTKCVVIYDDRPKVIRAWRAMGLTVCDVGNGVEF